MFRKILFSLLVLSLLVSPLSASGNRWTNKPPLGSSINWESPLSKGLVACFLMNEGGGKKINDLVYRNFDTTWYGNPLWKPTAKQISLQFDGANDYIEWVLPSVLSTSKPFTVVINIKNLGTNATKGFLYLNEDSNDFLTLCYFDANYNNLMVGRMVAGTYYSSKASSTLTTTKLNQIILTNIGGANRSTIFVNGILFDASLTGGPTEYATTRKIQIGRGYNLSTYSANCQIAYLYLYSRVLSSSEIQQLYQDPYCFIKPPTIWSMFSTAVAAARRSWTFD